MNINNTNLDYFKGNKINIALNKEFLKDFLAKNSGATTYVMMSMTTYLSTDNFLRDKNKIITSTDLSNLIDMEYHNLRKQIRILIKQNIVMEEKIIENNKEIKGLKMNDIIFSLVSSKEIYNYCIYRLIDKNGETLYVGKTNNIKLRIHQHKTKGHLPKECYNNISKVLYTNTNSDSESCIYEICCINYYLPRYNTEYKDGGIGNIIDIENLEWQQYSW